MAILGSSSSNLTVTPSHTIAQLYTLAEKLEDPSAQENFLYAFIDEIEKTAVGDSSHFPGISIVSTIYEGTVSGSPARKVLVDLYTHNDECYTPKTADKEDWPVEFLRDLEAGLGELGKDWIPSVKFQSPKSRVEKYLESKDGVLDAQVEGNLRLLPSGP